MCKGNFSYQIVTIVDVASHKYVCVCHDVILQTVKI
jgi:hypothetical protein